MQVKDYLFTFFKLQFSIVYREMGEVNEKPHCTKAGNKTSHVDSNIVQAWCFNISANLKLNQGLNSTCYLFDSWLCSKPNWHWPNSKIVGKNCWYHWGEKKKKIPFFDFAYQVWVQDWFMSRKNGNFDAEIFGRKIFKILFIIIY